MTQRGIVVAPLWYILVHPHTLLLAVPGGEHGTFMYTMVHASTMGYMLTRGQKLLICSEELIWIKTICNNLLKLSFYGMKV